MVMRNFWAGMFGMFSTLVANIFASLTLVTDTGSDMFLVIVLRADLCLNIFCVYMCFTMLYDKRTPSSATCNVTLHAGQTAITSPPAVALIRIPKEDSSRHQPPDKTSNESATLDAQASFIFTSHHRSDHDCHDEPSVEVVSIGRSMEEVSMASLVDVETKSLTEGKS